MDKITQRLKKKYLKAKLVKSVAMNNDIESQIVKIANDIRQSNENIFLSPTYIQTFDVMRLIQYILIKRSRTREEREVLMEFLRSLEKFMSLINLNCSIDLINEMLMRVSKSLQLQEAFQNNVLFRSGEKGAVFFIIIKGSVSVLISNTIKVQMTVDEYLQHLCFLNQMEEYELQEKTAENNKEMYQINLQNPAQPKVVNLVNKTLEQYDKREVSYNSVEEYIECLMPNICSTNRSYYPVFNIAVYHKVTNLIQGNTFGETALLSKDQKRTATIFINEDSLFGILNEFEFNMSLKTIQLQTKRDRVLFVMSFNIFDAVGYEFFVKKYWNNFTLIQMKQNDSLFHQKAKRDLVYFIREGEIELTTKLSILDIKSILKNFGEKNCLENIKLTISKPKKYKLASIKLNSIIGLDDVIYNNKYLCSGVCISKKAELFAIEYNALYQIVEAFKKKNQLKSITADKIKVMVDRLKTYVNIDNYVLEKEPYSIIKDKILSAFSNDYLPKVTRRMTKTNTPTPCSRNAYPIKMTEDSKDTLFQTSPSNMKVKAQKRMTYQLTDSIKSRLSKEKEAIDKESLGLTKGRVSLFTPYPTFKGYCTNLADKTDKLFSIRPISTIIRNKAKENSNRELTYDATVPSTIRLSNRKNTKKRNTIESTYDSDNKHTEQQVKAIAHEISTNSKQKKLLYSNLILKPNYTLSTIYTINNFMDYCLMEKDKEILTPLITTRSQKTKVIPLSKKDHLLLKKKNKAELI